MAARHVQRTTGANASLVGKSMLNVDALCRASAQIREPPIQLFTLSMHAPKPAANDPLPTYFHLLQIT